MVFESLEDDVPTWISFIDKWMAAANARHAEWETGPRPGPDTGNPAATATASSRELNEKFKNL